MEGRKQARRPLAARPAAGVVRKVCVVGAVAAWAAAALPAGAYTATLTPRSPKTIYLQIGTGSFTGSTYISGGSGARNTTIDTVSVIVPGAVLGNGAAQTMTTNSSAARSYYDNYLFCNLPNQLYVGGYYRTASGSTAAAQVVASVPANLANAAGNTITFSQISWTASGNGDGSSAQPFPSASFTPGAQQNVGSIASNQWAESCWTFNYLNTMVPAAGTYTATVTYTVTTP